MDLGLILSIINLIAPCLTILCVMIYNKKKYKSFLAKFYNYLIISLQIEFLGTVLNMIVLEINQNRGITITVLEFSFLLADLVLFVLYLLLFIFFYLYSRRDFRNDHNFSLLETASTRAIFCSVILIFQLCINILSIIGAATDRSTITRGENLLSKVSNLVNTIIELVIIIEINRRIIKIMHEYTPYISDEGETKKLRDSQLNDNSKF